MIESLHFQHFPVREGRPDQPYGVRMSTQSHKQERNQPRSLNIDALQNIIEKKNAFKKRKTENKEELHTGIVLIGGRIDSLNQNFEEKKIESVQRKDEQVFFNFFQGFPDTIEDTKIGAKPYFSYIVML